MAALGDKVSANILAQVLFALSYMTFLISLSLNSQTAQVPSIPWSGDGITSGLNSEGVIPQDVFNKACVFDVEQAAATADKIGYPVMIKARSDALSLREEPVANIVIFQI